MKKTLLAFALATLAFGCAKERAPLHPAGQPSWPVGQPPPPGYASSYGQPDRPAAWPAQPGMPAQPPPGGQPAPTTAHPPPGVGNALTPFGIIIELPPLFDFSQPLPGWSDWIGTLPWLQPPTGHPPPGSETPPQTPPGAQTWPAAWVAFEDEVLALTNERRAAGASCGGQPFAPAPPLSPHAQLRHAARGHSADMAERNFFDHETPEGVGPMERAQRAGYQGGFVGENIAAGHRTPAQVVQGWMDSPGHCLNIMEPRYRFLGVGFLTESGDDRYNRYWTQNFGG